MHLYRSLREKTELEIFLVDPSILMTLLSPYSRKRICNDPAVESMLREYQYSDIQKPRRTILAGVLSKQNLSIEIISVVSGAQNFEVDTIQEKLPNGIKLDVQNSEETILTHIVLTKNFLTLHILVFHFVLNSTFYWTSEFPMRERETSSYYVPLGNRQTIFDKFSTQSTTVVGFGSRNLNKTQFKILVPDYVPHFLQQIPHSTYISCNRDFSEFYRQKYSSNFSEEMRKKADVKNRFALHRFKELLRNSLVPFWACFGTLLGKFV